jgi:hypothetical protein
MAGSGSTRDEKDDKITDEWTNQVKPLPAVPPIKQ